METFQSKSRVSADGQKVEQVKRNITPLKHKGLLPWLLKREALKASKIITSVNGKSGPVHSRPLSSVHPSRGDCNLEEISLITSNPTPPKTPSVRESPRKRLYKYSTNSKESDITSHLLYSTDASDATSSGLTTLNRTSLALNDMFKQQLFLIKNDADVIRRRYLSTMSALENEAYHNAILQDTKEYIKQPISQERSDFKQKTKGENKWPAYLLCRDKAQQ